jgi:hypothetical protein
MHVLTSCADHGALRQDPLGGKEGVMTLHSAAGLLAVAAISSSAIAGASALAQNVPETRDPAATDLSVAVRATPSKAGTRRSPQGVAISATSTIATERGLDPPIVTGVDLLLGHGFSWGDGEYATCTRRVLDRRGPKGCPKESIMGRVVANARAGSVTTKPSITLVNGGAKRLWAHTRLRYPARVHDTVAVSTADLSGRRWSYKGTLRVPRSLQVVAGVPIRTTRIKLTIGGKPYARDYIATTSCPAGGWRYRASVHYLYELSGQTGRDTVDGTIACTS